MEAKELWALSSSLPSSRRTGYTCHSYTCSYPPPISSSVLAVFLYSRNIAPLFTLILQWVLSVDLFANEDADANVVIAETQSWTVQGEEVDIVVADSWSVCVCFVIVCVFGGVCRWRGRCRQQWERINWTQWCVWLVGGPEGTQPHQVPHTI